jgi:hypothetical protein
MGNSDEFEPPLAKKAKKDPWVQGSFFAFFAFFASPGGKCG